MSRKLLEACEDGDIHNSALRRRFTARNRAIVTLFIDTGIRLSELAGLHLGDIDRQRSCFYCYRKGKKQQQVPISNDGFKALHNYLQVSSYSG